MIIIITTNLFLPIIMIITKITLICTHKMTINVKRFNRIMKLIVIIPTVNKISMKLLEILLLHYKIIKIFNLLLFNKKYNK